MHHNVPRVCVGRIINKKNLIEMEEKAVTMMSKGIMQENKRLNKAYE
jgi:hypothetical protein